LRTTGFSGSGRQGTFWTWPIWEAGLGLDTCRSVLALDELQPSHDMVTREGSLEAMRNKFQTLRERGIVAVFRSQRVTEGKFRSFTPAQAML
jgi:hypothetical protein